MISRVADHCFWFGRYLERAESTARVLQVTNNLALDTELTQEQCWLPVIIVSGDRTGFTFSSGAGGLVQCVQHFSACRCNRITYQFVYTL